MEEGGERESGAEMKVGREKGEWRGEVEEGERQKDRTGEQEREEGGQTHLMDLAMQAVSAFHAAASRPCPLPAAHIPEETHVILVC